MALRLPFVGSLGTESDAPRRGFRFVKRFAALCVVAVLGVVVPVAEAAPFTPELEADYAYAEQWWGAVPSGCSGVTREVLPDTAMPGHGGQATQPKDGAAPIPCIIDIAEGSLAVTCQRREVVLHEYGHLLGYGHSEDPASIMYPAAPGTLCEIEVAEEESAETAAWLRQARAEQLRRCRRLQHRNVRRLKRTQCWFKLKEAHRQALAEKAGGSVPAR